MGSKYTADVEAAMRRFFRSLSERERRHYAAIEAAKLGRGGVAYLARALECDEKTIRRGSREMAQPRASDPLPPGRSRKKGVAGTR